MDEFTLIERIRSRVATRPDVMLGIGDDAALLTMPTGQMLAVSTDTLNEGVHFAATARCQDVGFKALAVSLSDLAAMAAEPAWATLSLSLPIADAEWLDGFFDGFLELAVQHRLSLVGGDTTCGPLSIGVTVHGFVPPGQALCRDAACVGDDIWVTGTLGDAAAGLALQRDPEALGEIGEDQRTWLLSRLHRPTPRLDFGLALRGLAHAAIDVSDGLLADLGHVLRASALGAELELGQLPTSEALSAAVDDDTRRWTLQTAGGDDYELCFTAPKDSEPTIRAAAESCALRLSCIGRIVSAPGLRLTVPTGRPWAPSRLGYQHFVDELT